MSLKRAFLVGVLAIITSSCINLESKPDHSISAGNYTDDRIISFFKREGTRKHKDGTIEKVIQIKKIGVTSSFEEKIGSKYLDLLIHFTLNKLEKYPDIKCVVYISAYKRVFIQLFYHEECTKNPLQHEIEMKEDLMKKSLFIEVINKLEFTFEHYRNKYYEKNMLWGNR